MELKNFHDLLTEESIVKCPINQIRYQVVPNIPQIQNSILACPISSFNLLPYAKRKVKEIDLKKQPLPEYMNCLKTLLQLQIPTYNHLLINVYPPGVGIMPHFDGPSYLPKVVVLSLGGPAIISFSDSYDNKKNKLSKLLLEDRSIHIFSGDAYEKVLHGIEDFVYDSIFLKVTLSKQPKIEVRSQGSVANYNQTRLKEVVEKKIGENQQKMHQFQEIQLTEEMNGAETWLLRVHQNQQYNWKVDIKRKQRISITIRQKLE